MRLLPLLALVALGCREATATTGTGTLVVQMAPGCQIPSNTPIAFTLDGTSQGWLAFSPSWSWTTTVEAGPHTSSAAMEGHAWPDETTVVPTGGVGTRTLDCPH